MGRVVHFEIHAADPPRAEGFYRDVFDWTIQAWDDPADYRLVTTGADNPGIDGAIVPRRGAIDGAPVIAFVCTVQVEDLAAIESKVVAAGGQQVVDRQDIPGVGQLSYFKDTEGNIFGALQPARSAG